MPEALIHEYDGFRLTSVRIPKKKDFFRVTQNLPGTESETLPVKRRSTVYTFFHCRKDRGHFGLAPGGVCSCLAAVIFPLCRERAAGPESGQP